MITRKKAHQRSEKYSGYHYRYLDNQRERYPIHENNTHIYAVTPCTIYQAEVEKMEFCGPQRPFPMKKVNEYLAKKPLFEITLPKNFWKKFSTAKKKLQEKSSPNVAIYITLWLDNTKVGAEIGTTSATEKRTEFQHWHSIKKLSRTPQKVTFNPEKLKGRKPHKLGINDSISPITCYLSSAERLLILPIRPQKN